MPAFQKSYRLKQTLITFSILAFGLAAATIWNSANLDRAWDIFEGFRQNRYELYLKQISHAHSKQKKVLIDALNHHAKDDLFKILRRTSSAISEFYLEKSETSLSEYLKSISSSAGKIIQISFVEMTKNPQIWQHISRLYPDGIQRRVGFLAEGTTE